MARVVVIHWNREIESLAAALRNGSDDVELLSPQGVVDLRAVRDDPPDAFVVDLSRSPSQGREVAASLRRFTATRYVPLVFSGGEPEKVARVRELMPDAEFTAWDAIAPALERGRTRPPEAPVVPGTMDAYASASLEKKLGVKDATVVAVSGAPAGFGNRLRGAVVRTSLRGRAELVILFVRSEAELEQRLPRAIRAMEDGGSVWIAWPKRASGVLTDLTQNAVRRIGMDAGLVDFKVAALDETWSGLRFVRRREPQHGRAPG